MQVPCRYQGFSTGFCSAADGLISSKPDGTGF
jgi:hypothetical protein